MPVVTVPRGIGDLTPEWLATALADRADGALVTDLVAIPIASGLVSDSVRLVPRWDRPTAAPPSVVAKVPSSDEVSRLTGFATRTFELEASFYNELAATVWVSRPSCYLAHYSLPQEGYVVLLEDMLPADPGDPVAGCSPHEAAAVMPELAALHGPRWGDPALLDMTWLEQPASESVRTRAHVLPNLFGVFVDRYASCLDRDLVRLGERVMGALDRYLADRPGPWTVLHSDLRLDNLLFGRPRVTVVDWHTVKVGPGLSDVSYFIGSSLAPEVRRDFECELVRAYHRQLASAGVDLAWEECWQGYRRYSLDGLVMAIAASTLDAASAHREQVGLTMVNRHGCQALDLGAEEFLPA
jgi:Phosphotransferase enzyme family